MVAPLGVGAAELSCGILRDLPMDCRSTIVRAEPSKILLTLAALAVSNAAIVSE